LLPSKIKTKQSYKRSLENLHVQLAFSFFTWLFSHDLIANLCEKMCNRNYCL
jgi:hypothetical protein